MSMARCDLCRALIDTDEDPESCVHDGYLCEACRPDLPSLDDELAQFDKWNKNEEAA